MSSKSEYVFFLNNAKKDLESVESQLKDAEVKSMAAQTLFEESRDACVIEFNKIVAVHAKYPEYSAVTKEHEVLSKEFLKSSIRSRDAVATCLNLAKRALLLTKRIKTIEFIISNRALDDNTIVKQIIKTTEYLYIPDGENTKDNDTKDNNDSNEKNNLHEKTKIYEFIRENSGEIPPFVVEYVEAWAKE